MISTATELNVNTTLILEASRQIEIQASSVRNIIDSLNACHTELCTVWKDEAQEEFSTSFTQSLDSLQDMQDMLCAMQRALSSVSNYYELAEKNIISQF